MWCKTHNILRVYIRAHCVSVTAAFFPLPFPQMLLRPLHCVTLGDFLTDFLADVCVCVGSVPVRSAAAAAFLEFRTNTHTHTSFIVMNFFFFFHFQPLTPQWTLPEHILSCPLTVCITLTVNLCPGVALRDPQVSTVKNEWLVMFQFWSKWWIH